MGCHDEDRIGSIKSCLGSLMPQSPGPLGALAALEPSAPHMES